MISPTFTSHRRRPPRERRKPPDRPCLQSTSFLDACKKNRTRDDFSSFSSRRLFDCFTTGSRARSATRAPITWTCSTSAASCPSSRAACARPPRPCGAPCLAARANRKGKDRVGGERKKKKRCEARTGVCGANGESAHRAHLLQRVIRGVEVLDILFARARCRTRFGGSA